MFTLSLFYNTGSYAFTYVNFTKQYSLALLLSYYFNAHLAT